MRNVAFYIYSLVVCCLKNLFQQFPEFTFWWPCLTWSNYETGQKGGDGDGSGMVAVALVQWQWCRCWRQCSGGNSAAVCTEVVCIVQVSVWESESGSYLLPLETLLHLAGACLMSSCYCRLDVQSVTGTYHFCIIRLLRNYVIGCW